MLCVVEPGGLIGLQKIASLENSGSPKKPPEAARRSFRRWTWRGPGDLSGIRTWYVPYLCTTAAKGVPAGANGCKHCIRQPVI